MCSDKSNLTKNLDFGVFFGKRWILVIWNMILVTFWKMMDIADFEYDFRDFLENCGL